MSGDEPMSVRETVVLVTSIAVVCVWMGIVIVAAERGWSCNPLRWRAQHREDRRRAEVYRLSRLEHDLGYTPCCDDECRSCRAQVAAGQGGHR